MIQLKKGIKILIGAILVLGVATYAVYAAIIASNPSPEDRCTHIELNIEQNLHSGFITNEIIENELHKANIYPKERLLADIRTRDIEKTLMKNEFIEQVECYKTANNTVTINIKQRTPVIYILPDNGKGYYIDKYGKIITKTNYPVNLPVATGIMSEAYATKCLSKLGAYIVNDEFWNSQIEQIYVKANADRDVAIAQAAAQKEANETIYWLKVISRCGYIDDQLYGSLVADAEELIRIITSIILSLKRKHNT